MRTIAFKFGAGAAALIAVAALSAPPAQAATNYRVCKPGVDSMTYSGPYPYSFMLTTSYRYTTNSNIRASVRSIQNLYNAWLMWEGVSAPRLLVDGAYGPKTATAMKTFQAHEGITVNGKVGVQTWRKLGTYCSIFH